MSKNYADFFRIIKKLNEDGVVNSRNYLDDVLRSITKEFIPENKIFFSSNCPHGRAIEIPFIVEDVFYIVLGANYPIGKENEVIVYQVEKDKIRNLLKGEYFQFSKEVLLQLTPIKIIEV